MKPRARAIHQPDGCPDAMDLWAFAEGTLDPESSAKVMMHVTDCAECAALLKIIGTQGEDDLSAAELAMLDSLPSATPAGRTALVKKILKKIRGSAGHSGRRCALPPRSPE